MDEDDPCLMCHNLTELKKTLMKNKEEVSQDAYEDEPCKN